jgi:hypothetical protein
VLSVKRRIMLDPNYRNYTDCALTPMQDDDELTLDLLTKTSGAKAAIDHLKKVHDLTHAKPAVAAEVSRQPAAASRTVGGARAQQPLQLAACLQIPQNARAWRSPADEPGRRRGGSRRSAGRRARPRFCGESTWRLHTRVRTKSRDLPKQS